MKLKLLDKILIMIALVVLCVSGYQLFLIFQEYKAGTDEYSQLQSYAQRLPAETAEEKQEEQGDTVPAIPQLQVDFDGLEAINPDMKAWLYMPVLEMEYPVVQGEDNDYYITHTFENKVNNAGAIFIDSQAAGDFLDWNTFIYGHNMKNRSMFGKLKLFGQDEELCRSDPYFYIYTKDRACQYLIVSYYVTEDGSPAYSSPATEEEYEKYLQMILRSTPYRAEQEIPSGEPLVTLSTCYGQAGGEQRFVVHGILNAVEEYAEE